MAERKRLQWEIKNEEKNPTNILERDEKYDRRREARQELKRLFTRLTILMMQHFNVDIWKRW